MAKVLINGANFYYELHGQGHPLVLISGYRCDHSFWKPILEPLSRSFQVLVFDNRAVGQTQDSQVPLTAALMADDVIALTDALNLKKPHIIGQSMGGTIAQSIGERYSNKITRLIIMNSCPKWRQATLIGLDTLIKMQQSNVNLDIIFQTMLAWMFGDDFLKNKDKIQSARKDLLENLYPQSIENQIRQFDMIKTFDGRAALGLIKAPALIFHGKQDLVTLSDQAHFMADRIPHATFVEYDCAHQCISEIPEQLIPLFTHFFSHEGLGLSFASPSHAS